MLHKKLILLGSAFLISANALFAAPTYKKLCSEYDKVCENGKCGVAYNGHRTAMKYDDVQCISAVSLPTIMVSANGKWGLYNVAEERELGPIKYETIADMADMSHAKVQLDGKWGMVHTYNGKEMIPPAYQEIEFLDTLKEYAKAKDKAGWHIFALNKDTAQKLSTLAYEKVEPLKNYYKGYYQVQSKGKKGVVTLTATEEGAKLTEFVPAEFEDVVMPPAYTAVKVSKGGKWAFYSLDSKKITTPFYDSIEKQFNLYQVSLKGKVGLVAWNKQTQEMEEVMAPAYEKTKKILGEQLIGVFKNGKWGVYNVAKKKLVLPCEYEDVKNGFGAKEVKVKKGEEWVKQKLAE